MVTVLVMIVVMIGNNGDIVGRVVKYISDGSCYGNDYYFRLYFYRLERKPTKAIFFKLIWRLCR